MFSETGGYQKISQKFLDNFDFKNQEGLLSNIFNAFFCWEDIQYTDLS